ncbi:ABC transporter ATP-binding protein [Paenibacillus cymbidii]|uniref:ABC transporter ATP-binding protein n=1 Tax=Paenibacillus cymbidii TaxID=1639034 RepID=UPI00108114E1|nr:ABC transporter ATP-binding protein [Paenibacillus cymbidii]
MSVNENGGANRAGAERDHGRPQAIPGLPGPGGPGRGGAPVPKVRARNTGATVRRLWGYLARQRGGLGLVYALTLCAAGVALFSPYLLGTAIDKYVLAGDLNDLLRLCAFLLVLYFAGSVFTWLQTYVMTGITGRMVKSLRSDLFDRYQLLPLSFFDRQSKGDLMSRTTNDIENVANTLNQTVTQLLTSLITLGGSLFLMLRLNLPLTAVSLITIPLVLLATRSIARLSRTYFAGQQKKLGELNGLIEETVGGQKVVQIFRRERESAAQFQAVNGQLTTQAIKAQIVSGLVGPFMNLFNNLGFALIAAIGGWMVYRDWTTLGVVVAFLNYSRQFGRPIADLANQYNLIQSGVAGAERVFEMIDMESEYAQRGGELPPDTNKPRHTRGHVSFEGVSFSYRPDTPVLTDVTFEAKPGQMIALVGPTGAGKTSIVNLVNRFYETNAGTIRIDGTDIRTLDKDALRGLIGMVLQDSYVFSGTIRDNIRYGKLDATDEQIREAARLANADSFIARLPHGYDTALAPEGSNLSQGQRQLLTIARAILADPAILILDEATSSIDTRTEMHIQEAMRRLMKDRTSLVIAHRLSTIRDADTILVLNGGRLIERGTHAELMAAGGFYAQLHASQYAG